MKFAPLIAASLLLCLHGTVTAGTMAPVKGQVLEVREVDMYTYLRLKTSEGETWAAVSKSPVKVGSEVTVSEPMLMQNFESKALKKTFDKIVFGSLDEGHGPSGAKAHASMGGGPAGTGAPVVARLSKAAGADARTVAEVVSGKNALKDKSVSLHAQVVKVNTGIMGKNWLHVQDGSGSASASTHDILVTSKDSAAVGDVLTIKGTVRTDMKFGAGYDYDVLIEDAALRK